MKKAEVIIIAAKSKENVIGYSGGIPWNIKQDMKRFRKLTLGKCVIMGRNTYCGLPKKLDGRKIIVVSRSPGFNDEGTTISSSVQEALSRGLSLGLGDVYVAGGQLIYEKAMEFAQRLEITEVEGEYNGYRFFPEIDLRIWKRVWKETHFGDPTYSFNTYRRR